jgi:hypothetical protein
VQLDVIGNGDKTRNILLSATLAHDLWLCAREASQARVFAISERRVA